MYEFTEPLATSFTGYLFLPRNEDDPLVQVSVIVLDRFWPTIQGFTMAGEKFSWKHFIQTAFR